MITNTKAVKGEVGNVMDSFAGKLLLFATEKIKTSTLVPESINPKTGIRTIKLPIDVVTYPRLGPFEGLGTAKENRGQAKLATEPVIEVDFETKGIFKKKEVRAIRCQTFILEGDWQKNKLFEVEIAFEKEKATSIQLTSSVNTSAVTSIDSAGREVDTTYDNSRPIIDYISPYRALVKFQKDFGLVSLIDEAAGIGLIDFPEVQIVINFAGSPEISIGNRQSKSGIYTQFGFDALEKKFKQKVQVKVQDGGKKRYDEGYYKSSTRKEMSPEVALGVLRMIADFVPSDFAEAA